MQTKHSLHVFWMHIYIFIVSQQVYPSVITFDSTSQIIAVHKIRRSIHTAIAAKVYISSAAKQVNCGMKDRTQMTLKIGS